MIQLRQFSETIDPDAVLRLKLGFEERSCVRLPRLLGTDLLEFLLPRLERGTWMRRDHAGIGADEILNDEPSLRLLHFVANTPGYLAAVRRIGGCAEISALRGQLYRLMPNSSHFDSWHSDEAHIGDQRMIGMSINLGSRAYAGGMFQLRENDTGRIIFEVANTGCGDAILFRLSKHLKHRVTAVTGSEPRVAFAGWFCSGVESFIAPLRKSAPDR